jgi:hypothetical protein
MTEEQTPECECAARGIPEGYLCGKRGCPRTIAVEKSFNDPDGRMQKMFRRWEDAHPAEKR